MGEAVVLAGQRQRRRKAGERVVAEGRARDLQDELVDIGNRAYVMRRDRVVHDGDCIKLLKSPDELHPLYLGG